jgi:hypothetical protein
LGQFETGPANQLHHVTAVADSDGKAQVGCPIRNQFESRVYAAIQILAKYSSRLVEITGTGKLASQFALPSKLAICNTA